MSEQSPIEDPQPDDAWNELVKTITSAANDDKLLELHQQIEPSKWDQYIDSLTSDGAKFETLQSFVKPDGTFIDSVLQATYPDLPLDSCDTLIQKTQKEFPLTSEWIATSGPNANEAPRLESVMQGTFSMPFVLILKTRIWGSTTHTINRDVQCTVLNFEKDKDVLAKAINDRNIRLGWPSPFELPMLNLPQPPPGNRPTAVTTDPGTAVILHMSNRVGMGYVQSLSTAELWKQDLEGFAWAVQPFPSGEVQMTIGLPKSDQADALWRTLCTFGPVGVKIHFALWACLYEAKKERPNDPVVVVEINRMCELLGYKKDRGSFPVKTKQDVRAILQALAEVQMKGSYTPSKKGASKQRFTGGRLWDVVLHEKEYGDLFGQAGEGDPKNWDPLQFAYRPGMAQLDEQWLKHNSYVGKVSAGLLRIPNNQEWALLIGGYLAFLFRFNQYRTIHLRISTILAKIGRGQSTDRRRVTELKNRLWTALDVLKEYGVITDYQKPRTAATTDIDDPDDEEELAEYYKQEPEARTDWRSGIVTLYTPNEADMQRLTEQTNKAIETAHKKSTRKKKAAIPN